MAMYIGCPLKGDFNLYIRKEEDVENDEVLERLITITEDHTLSTFLYEIFGRLFKGKYYSNAYNFAQVLKEMQLTSSEYNTLIEKLVNLGVLVEVDERVFELADGVGITERNDEEVRNG